MFEIGFWELVMIGVVALIVVGPERLPGLARKAGLWLGKARRMVAEVKADVDRELHLEELKQSLRQQTGLKEVQDLADRVKTARREFEEDLKDLGPPPDWRPGMPTSPPPYSPSAPEEPAAIDSSPVRLQKPESAPTAPSPAASVSSAPTPPAPPASNSNP
ncbi:MAG: twin-arginine translocase subunit TatB [Candidatus Competibacteraceae bacterium]|nr:MAG: twin-arginine translocase subunit TatB [Candidatus Competibacteraceae bacterium]